MDFAAIRSRLAGSEGVSIRRSLGELVGLAAVPRIPAPRDFPSRRRSGTIPKGAPRVPEADERVARARRASTPARSSRRKDRPLRAASPRTWCPGRPLFFATAVPFGGDRRAGRSSRATRVIRPKSKAIRNIRPASAATDIFAQAAILTLYDPDRSQTRPLSRRRPRRGATSSRPMKGRARARRQAKRGRRASGS